MLFLICLSAFFLLKYDKGSHVLINKYYPRFLIIEHETKEMQNSKLGYVSFGEADGFGP